MAALRIGFIVFLVLLGLCLVVLLAFPTGVEVSREIDIEAPPGKIYPYLANLHLWQQWTPWSKQRYPDLVQEFGVVEQGVGAELRWKGPKMGEGWLKIVKADPQSRVEYELRTLSGKVRFQGSLKLTPGEGSTRVLWHDQGDLGFFGALLKGTIAAEIGKDFEGSLARLKNLCEEG